MAISLGGFSGGGGAGAITSVNGLTGVVVVDGDNIESNHTAVNYTPTSSTIAGHLSGIDAKFGTLVGGMTYKGTFNATTGLPSIANALQGDFYKISTGGTIYGKTFEINDSLLINADMGGVIDNAKIDKIDNTEPTNVLITTNNLSDLDNAGTARTNLGLGTAATSASTDFLQVSNNLSDVTAATARTNLGLGTAATANTGTSNGNVVVLDATGLPAVDGSQLTNVTSTDASKLAIANNLSDLNSASTARTNLGLGTAATAASTDFLQVSNNLSDVTAATARTNLGLGTAATANTGTSNGNVVVLDATGLPAVDGSQLTNVTSTDASKLAIANNLSDLNSASTARTNLGLGTAATANTGTSNGNVVVLDATGLPAVDGSQLTNVTSTDSSKLAIANNLSDLNNAGTARTNLGLGTAATAASTDFLQVSNNLSDVTAATARTNLGLGTAATAASTDFLSGTGADTLGGNLDVGTSDIVSSSNNNIEFAANGTGVVKVIPTATGGHLELNGDGTNVGKLRLMCEQSSHGIYLTGPSHAASASYTLKFPDTTGTPNYVLKTDGSGNLDWVAQSGGGGGGTAPTVTEQNTTATLSNPASGVIEEIYTVDSSSSVIITLALSATVGEGFKYQIKRLGTGSVLIQCAGSEYIDYASQTTFSIGAQYDSVTLVANATTTASWLLI